MPGTRTVVVRRPLVLLLTRSGPAPSEPVKPRLEAVSRTGPSLSDLRNPKLMGKPYALGGRCRVRDSRCRPWLVRHAAGAGRPSNFGTGRSRRRGCSGRAGGHPSSAGRCGQRWWLGVRSTRRPSRRGRAPGVVRRASRCRFSVMGSGPSIPARWLTSLLRPLMADERPFSRLVPTDQNDMDGVGRGDRPLRQRHRLERRPCHGVGEGASLREESLDGAPPGHEYFQLIPRSPGFFAGQCQQSCA